MNFKHSKTTKTRSLQDIQRDASIYLVSLSILVGFKPQRVCSLGLGAVDVVYDNIPQYEPQ